MKVKFKFTLLLYFNSLKAGEEKSVFIKAKSFAPSTSQMLAALRGTDITAEMERVHLAVQEKGQTYSAPLLHHC